jgi:serine/threonine-protein kinase
LLLNRQYDVLNLLAEGGTGRVHKAIDTYSGFMVAIKFLHSSMTKHEALMRQFQIEANQYLHLNHFHIVKLKDFNIHPSPYIVMEYIDGQNLDNIINHVTGPMEESRVINVMLQILDGMDYTHNANVLHLDIKPANIMIDKHNFVKIIDFGICRSAEEEEDSVLGGTPFYLSPEQILKKKVNHQTDIYAIGLTMFKMLCGRLPFPQNIELNELNDFITKEEIPPLKTFYPFVSEKMEAIVQKAISKNPENRYANCMDFKKDIAGLI